MKSNINFNIGGLNIKEGDIGGYIAIPKQMDIKRLISNIDDLLWVDSNSILIIGDKKPIQIYKSIIINSIIIYHLFINFICTIFK